MAVELRCDRCGDRVDIEGEKVKQWWRVKGWPRDGRDMYGRPDLGTSPRDEVEKDFCPACMVEVAQAMGRR